MAEIALLKKLADQREKSAWYTPLDAETNLPYGDEAKPFRIHLKTPKSDEWFQEEREWQAAQVIARANQETLTVRDVTGFIKHRIKCHIAITLGWEGLLDVEGNEVPCTPETMRNLYSDRDFQVGLFAFTNSLSNYAMTPEDDAEKKSVNGLSGVSVGASTSA